MNILKLFRGLLVADSVPHGGVLSGLLLVILLFSGCASPQYLSDRGRDAGDIFTLTFGRGLGAKARVGPVAAGLLANEDLVGLRGGELGFFNTRSSDVPLPEVGDLQLLLVGSDCCYVGGHQRNKNYGAGGLIFWQLPEERGIYYYYSQVEVTVALGLSVRLGINPGELLDFLLGWFGVDFYDDDVGKYERWERQAADPKSRPRRLLKLYQLDVSNHQELACLLAANPATPPALLAQLATNSAQDIRAALVKNPAIDKSTRLDWLEKAVRSPDWKERKWAAESPQVSLAWLEKLGTDPDTDVRAAVALNPLTPAHLLVILAQDKTLVRMCVAGNIHTPLAVLQKLAKDQDAIVAGHAREVLNKLHPAHEPSAQ